MGGLFGSVQHLVFNGVNVGKITLSSANRINGVDVNQPLTNEIINIAIPPPATAKP